MAADPERIDQLTETTTLADDDVAPIVDKSDTAQAASGSTRKFKLSTLRSFFAKDEDDMASNSATHFPTQQSVKAYVTSETSQLQAESVTIDAEAGTDAELKFTEGGADRFGIRFRGTASDRFSIWDYGAARFVAQIVGGVLDLTGATRVTVPDGDVSIAAVNKGQLDAATSQFSSGIFLGPDDLGGVFASPTWDEQESFLRYISLDAGNDAVSGTFRVPSGWTSVNVSVLTFNTSTTAGSALFRADVQAWGVGDTLARSVGAIDTLSYPASDLVVQQDTIRSAIAVTGDEFMTVAVVRGAGGTLSGTPVGLLGVLIESA